MVARIEINVQKINVLLYGNNKQMETEILKCSTIYNFFPQTKWLSVKLTKCHKICLLDIKNANERNKNDLSKPSVVHAYNPSTGRLNKLSQSV